MQKIPWWLQNHFILNLIVVNVLLGTVGLGQLFFPSFGLLLTEQGLISHYGTLLMTGMASQLVISLTGRILLRWWSVKTTALSLVIISVLPDLLLIFAIKEAHIPSYYVSLSIGPGLCATAGMFAQLMLRKQLDEDHITGTSFTTTAAVLGGAMCTWLSFQAHLLVWGYVSFLIKVPLIIMLIKAKPEADEPKPLKFRGLLKDPALRITLGNLTVLFVAYCFRSLLPLATIVQHVDNLLFWTMIATGLLQLPLNWFFKHHQQISNWLFLFYRTAILIGFTLMVYLGGSFWWLIIGGSLWAIGNCNNSLIRHVNHERTHDKALGSTLIIFVSSLANMLGGFYIWMIGKIEVDYQLAMNWLLLPAGFSVVLALVMWNLHKLPAKTLENMPSTEEKSQQSRRRENLAPTTPATVQPRLITGAKTMIVGGVIVSGIVLWTLYHRRQLRN